MGRLGCRDVQLDARDMAYIKLYLSNMLEQRRAQEKGYITLKEAAEISNYTPDYVGQLIRAGKIKGEQVYCNVAWVTTPEEIKRYSNRKNTKQITKDIAVLEFAIDRKQLSYFLCGVLGIVSFCVLFLPLLFTTLEAGEISAVQPVEPEILYE